MEDFDAAAYRAAFNSSMNKDIAKALVIYTGICIGVVGGSVAVGLLMTKIKMNRAARKSQK